MPALERRTSLRGARFWLVDVEELWVHGKLWARQGGTLMFCNQIDGSTRDGPREATEEDVAAFPQAHADMDLAGNDAPGKPMISVRDPERKPADPPRPYAAKREAARQREQA